MQKERLNKILGALYGCALGDALGAPFEFRCSPSIKNYTGTISLPIVMYNRYQGLRRGAIGQVTDDTEMSLALLNSILTNGIYDINDVILSYMKWANSSSFIGRNTKALFKGVKTLSGYERRYQNKLEEEKEMGNYSLSNGSLMRLSPFSILCYTDPDNVKYHAVRDTELTNPTFLNISATELYIELMNSCLKNEKIEIHSKNKTIQNTIKIAIQNPDYNLETIKSAKGLCINGLYCAIRAIKNSETKSFQECIDDIIRLGGDTDTNGAIAGTLLGAKFGLKKIMEDKITSENLIKILNCKTSSGDFPRPENYHPLYIHHSQSKIINLLNK